MRGGINQGTISVVGNAIGLMHTNSAKRSYRVIFFSELTMNLLFAMLMIVKRDKIADLYSNND